MTALATIEAEEVQQKLLVRLGEFRDELARIDGLVRAHPQANKDWARLVADISESANGLEALLIGGINLKVPLELKIMTMCRGTNYPLV